MCLSTTKSLVISKRELEVVKLMAMGYNNRQIGKQLFISELTVQTHRKNMVKRLGFRNSHQLVAWACLERICIF